MPTFVRTKKSDEKTPPKQAAISHAMIQNKLPRNNKLQKKYLDGDHNASSAHDPS